MHGTLEGNLPTTPDAVARPVTPATQRALPAGWRWARLGDVCQVVSGATPSTDVPAYWDGNIPWVTPTDLGRLAGPSLEQTERRITKAGLANCSAKMVPAGTVLMSSRAPIGHLAVASIPCCANQGCKNLVPGPTVDTWYLYYALKMLVPVLKALGRGATFTEISKATVESVHVPLAPLDEQRRIAAILTDQMAAVDRARAAAQAQVAAAEALPAAYLRAVFDGEYAQRWPNVNLGVVGDIVSGVTLGRKLGDRAITGPVPYLRVANVKDGYLSLSDVFHIDVTEVEAERWRLKWGDLLLTEGGDPDKLGRGTFWEEQIPECIHQNHIFRVRFDPGRFVPQFVSWQVASPYGKTYFLKHAKRTTGIATINQKVLGAFPLMAPTYGEQQSVVASLAAQMASVDQIRHTLQDELAAINALPSSLLREAFNGRL